MKNIEKRFEELKNQNVMSIDAESNGLWGKAFAIAAVVYDVNGNEIERFTSRCPIEETVNSWVFENVLPKMEDIKETSNSYEDMLREFFEFLKRHKDAKTLCHMGHVVESRLLLDAHSLGIIGDWDAPYEWYDVCVLFGDSVDTYNSENGVGVGKDLVGGTHNPLYDCIAAYAAFRHIITE